MVRETSSTWERSARPSARGGVPTQRKMMSDADMASSARVLNLSLPASRLAVSNSCSPGSWIVGVPSERRATMSGSLSIAVTVWPTSARPTAVTNPA